jgi:hypothetical protein
LPESGDLCGNTSNFVNSGLNLHKRTFGLSVKFGTFLDGGATGVCGQQQTERIDLITLKVF